MPTPPIGNPRSCFSPNNYGFGNDGRVCYIIRSMKILKWILPVTLVYGAFAYGAGSGADKFVGKPMPAFTMTSFDGKTISNASLKGKPYILDFWATWCGPCKAASPTMQSIHQKYASKGLVVIGASVDEPVTMAAAKKYPKEHGYTYTFATNTTKIAEKLQMEGVPCFMFVGKDGKVKAVKLGFGGPGSSPEDFEKLAKSLL